MSFNFAHDAAQRVCTQFVQAGNDYFPIASSRLLMAGNDLMAKLSPFHSRRILDVGGNEDVTKVLDAGFGDDPNPPRIDYINAEFRFVHVPGSPVLQCFDARTMPLPWPDSTFDVVMCWETIEHLFTVRKDCVVSFEGVRWALAEMRRVLKPGGLLHMTTTNRFCPRTLAAFKRGAAAMINAPTSGHMGHVHEFSGPELWQAVATAGFRVTHLTSFNAYNMHFTEEQARTWAGPMRQLIGREVDPAEMYDTLLLHAEK